MGGLSERLTALEEAAAKREQVVVPAVTLEEATRRYMEWKSAPPPEDYVNPFEGVPPERVVEVYLERIGAGAGRVPKGRG